MLNGQLFHRGGVRAGGGRVFGARRLGLHARGAALAVTGGDLGGQLGDAVLGSDQELERGSKLRLRLGEFGHERGLARVKRGARGFGGGHLVRQIAMRRGEHFVRFGSAGLELANVPLQCGRFI